jgi:hypothetical protein
MAGDPSGGSGGTASGTKTFIETEATTSTTVVPSILSRNEHIAQFFTADLEAFLQLTHLDLANELQLPPDYFQDPRDIIAMLYDDLTHMLQDELIIGIHLLLSDNALDPNSGAYPVRYHVQYTIDTSAGSSGSSASPQPFGGLIAPPRDVLKQTRLTLLIDWNSSAGSNRTHMRRPYYNFDWVPESARFDGTTVLQYSEGGLTGGGAEVKRVEKR